MRALAHGVPPVAQVRARPRPTATDPHVLHRTAVMQVRLDGQTCVGLNLQTTVGNVCPGRGCWRGGEPTPRQRTQTRYHEDPLPYCHANQLPAAGALYRNAAVVEHPAVLA